VLTRYINLAIEKRYVRRVMREITRENSGADALPVPPTQTGGVNPSPAILKEHPRFMEL
jgi:hypothetical protein